MVVVCVLGLASSVGAQTSKIAFSMSGGGFVGGLYVMDAVPGSTPILLKEGYVSHEGWLKGGGDPDWSPDGSEIVYRWHETRGAKHYVDIWIIGADGSNDREILRQERVEGRHDVLPLIENPAWSPDGSLIAVKIQLPGRLCFVRPDGVVARCPGVPGTLGVFLDWTPDGRHIVHQYSSADGIAIVEVGGTPGTLGPERVIHEGVVTRVQVSPDGSRIVYASHKDPETGRNVLQVRLVDIDGSNERFLVEGTEPCWSPDSRRIAFVELDEDEGTRALKVVDVDGSNPRVLLEHSGWFHYPAWSPLLPAETATPASSWGEVKHKHRSR